MLLFAKGSEDTVLTEKDIRDALYNSFDRLGEKKKVLAIPPDLTRFHSRAGELTRYSYYYYKEKMTDILPAVGTHFPMTGKEIEIMYGDTPKNIFREHKWKEDLVTLGKVPSEFLNKVSEGKVNYDWDAQVNKMIIEGGYDLILSIGQVVPHEVIGMANYNKNIFIGAGGKDSIHKSHFLGAVYGMERIMGRADTPVRRVLNYASEHFARELPVIYVLTVIGKDDNNLVMRGLFIGDDYECFEKAAALSLKVNFIMMEKPLNKIVVYLDPMEFKSTWLGNKSIYRTRMVIADGGELIVLAPGLREFGEDKEIDRLIRKYGYKTTPQLLDLVDKNKDLQNNLGAAAHLIHGSTEGRFNVIYSPGSITKEEIENANFNYAPLPALLKKYNPSTLKDGFNTLPGGEEFFYISNPALGLWSTRERFN